MKVYSILAIGLSACLVLSAYSGDRHPHVTGYERFHAAAPSVEGGAILYSELGCANCHGKSDVMIPRQGPELVDCKIRISYDWVLGYLKDPQSAKAGSNMPHLTEGLSDEEIKSIAGFLGSLGKAGKLKPGRHVNAERGSSLYHEKGCVACHSPTSDFLIESNVGELGESPIAVGFPDLKNKYSLTSLDFFLSRVSRIRKDGRMPHTLLEKQESLDIAGHLIDFQASDPREGLGLEAWPKADKEEIAAGKVLVEKLRCSACHSIPGIQPPAALALPEKAEGHCLSESPGPGLPRYRFSVNQRASLLKYLNANGIPQEKQDEVTLAALNCFACHTRDGIGGPPPETNSFFTGNESLGDSGRLPPPLTGIGSKLQTAALQGVFSGKITEQVRPYLNTRMPTYPNHATQLADWFTKMDYRDDVKALAWKKEDLESGKKLLGIQGGVNCITCHHWEDKKSLGIPGPDLAALDRRIRPEWFRRYLLDPAGYRPGTLMPPLWPGGKSMIPDILDGDAERQISAIWGFIKEGESVPAGYPDHRSGEFELVPKDRAIIQRTFFEKTGAKAILVGFPGNIHLAYDGLKAKPSMIWRGKFFDAYNTWYTRAAPFEKPLGEEVYEFDPSGESSRFLGYRIDAKGNPTFLLSKKDQKIEESFQVNDEALVRTMVWDKGTAPAVIHPAGVQVEETSGTNSRTFIYSWK